MEGAVQVDPSAGQVIVGVERHACLLADGDVVVHGCRLRPITVGERALAVALAGHGSGRAGRLATLVWQASSGEPGPPPAAMAAALEAIALHLAGAGAAGPLARTLVVVSRALGTTAESVQAMAAIAADHLAASLAGALGDGEAEDGWTSISFLSDPVDPVGLTAAEVRDVLAERLARRADDPLEPGVLDIVGDAGESYFTPSAFPSGTSPGAAATTASSDSRADEGERRHADRWGALVAARIAATSAGTPSRPAPGEGYAVVPPAGKATAASSGPRGRLRRDRPGTTAGTGPLTSIGAPEELARASGSRTSSGHEPTVDGTASHLSNGPGVPVGGGPGRNALDAGSGGRWGAVAPAADGQQGARAGSTTARVPNTPELGARVARLLGLPLSERPGVDAQAVVGDVLGLALHEAADLRGVAR